MDNIKVVDDIVKQTERLFLEFYGDEDTVFIFTADHGMSKIGNHGDGGTSIPPTRAPRCAPSARPYLGHTDPDNTRTPLIAWGKGIRGPLPDSNPSSHDGYSLPWYLNDIYRRDVEQADVAALMAALTGIDWPINSVGVLPDADPMKPGFLKTVDGGGSEAKLALVNAKVRRHPSSICPRDSQCASKVVLEHFRRKHCEEVVEGVAAFLTDPSSSLEEGKRTILSPFRAVFSRRESGRTSSRKHRISHSGWEMV